MGGEPPVVVSLYVRVVFLFSIAGARSSVGLVFDTFVGCYYVWSQWLAIMIAIAPLGVASKTMT